jgi:hypothetical protein
VTWLYVAAVYFVALYLARRAKVEFPWKIGALFYALVLVYLFQPMTRDVVNLPADFIETMPPWVHTGHMVTAANRDLNDLVLQLAPWAHQVRESWRAGDVPLWNAMAGSGYPLLANAQSSALSPLRLLALPLPFRFSFTAEAAWKILIALSFTWLLCRRRGYSELASTFGAIAFGFCSFIVVWLHFPLITSACLVPAILYAVDLLAERITYGRFVFAAVTWTVMLFGGHPETASHTFFIAVLLTAWIIVVERPFAKPRDTVRFILTLGGAMAVAGLLASPYLLPLLEAITRSKRYAELQVTPNVFGYYSDWYSTMAWLQPQFYGGIPLDHPWGPATAESITGFTGALGVAAWFALAAWVIRTRSWRSREAFFVLATALVLALIFAWPGVSQLFHLVFKLAANARLRLLLCLLASLQVAAVVDLLQRGFRREFLFGVAASSILLLVMINGTKFPLPVMKDTAVAAILPSLVVLLAATAAATIARAQRPALLVLLVLVVSELWTATAGWNPVIPSALWYPETPMLRELQALKKTETAPFRIVGFGPTFFPNISSVYGFEDIRAHDPMANSRYLGVLRVLGGYNTSDYFALWKQSEPQLLNFLNVRYLLTPPKAELPDTQRYSVVYDGRDGKIFRNNDAMPRWYVTPNVILEFRDDEFVKRVRENRDWSNTSIVEELEVSKKAANDLLSPRPASAPNATIEMRRSKPTDWEMTVDAPRHTMVVSSIPYWPGWKVLIAGEPIPARRVNGAFLGFVAPPGTTDVRIVYDPMSFRVGAWIAGLALIALIAAPRVKRRFLAA